MSEAKFTKGEWVSYIGACDTQEIRVDDYVVIGWQGFDGVAICEDEKAANAHLIAAAPEMYKEIEDDVKNLKSLLMGFDPSSLESAAIEKKISRKKKLLAKARGE